MSKLISRILLAMLMFPLAALLYVTVTVMCAYAMRDGSYTYRENVMFGVAGGATGLFMAAYWLALWFGSVRWTSMRVTLSAMAGLASLFLGGVIVGLAAAFSDRDMPTFGVFLATTLPTFVWLVATVFIFRETARERRARLEESREAIVCPVCSYNLTGLTSTRCPECGAVFTLDQLMRNQPARAPAELERP